MGIGLGSRENSTFGMVTVAIFSFAFFTDTAQAHDKVFWSFGAGLPSIEMNAGNVLPIYMPPQYVHLQPAPIFVLQNPVYIERSSRDNGDSPRGGDVPREYRSGKSSSRHWGRRHGDESDRDE